VPREWEGSVYQMGGQASWCANWKEFGTERWRRAKGFPSKAAANDFLAQKRKDYRTRRHWTTNVARSTSRSIRVQIPSATPPFCGASAQESRRRVSGERRSGTQERTQIGCFRGFVGPLRTDASASVGVR